MNKNVADRIIIPLCILAIIISGYSGLFFGHSLFVDEDIVLLFQENSIENKANGWRSDVKYGTNLFFSDPGTVHPWSLFGFWSNLFNDRVFGQNLLFIILVWFACLSQYMFLCKLVPRADKPTLVCLAVLIPFSSLRYEFIFLYCNIIQIIATSLGSLLLYEFLTKPKLRHYFYYTLIIWALVFMGSAVSLFQFLSFSLLFYLGMIVYYEWYKEWANFGQSIWQYLKINLVAGFLLFLLGGWVFYSLFVEQTIVGYVRTSNYDTGAFLRPFDLLTTISRISSYLHAGFLSPWSSELGISQRFNTQSWNHLSPITPVIIVIFLFFKNQNFWEFIAKFVVIGSYLYHEIFFWFPGFFNLVQKVIHLYPPFKMYPYIQVYQVAIIAFLIYRVTLDSKKSWVVYPWNIPRILALMLSSIYICGLAFVFFLKTFPDQLLKKFLDMTHSMALIFEFNKEFVENLIVENILLFEEIIVWYDFLFYGSTLFILGIFISYSWPLLIRYKNGLIFSMLLLVNNYFLSMSVYPLNREPLIWDQQEGTRFSGQDVLYSTDRFARVKLPACRNRPHYQECVKNKFFNEEFGAKRYKVGYRAIPSMEFSKATSFISKPTLEFFKNILRDPKLSGRLSPYNIFEIENVWGLFEMGAVNYFLSPNELPKGKKIDLEYKGKQFYLYRNNNAWPYYYFADRIEVIENYESLFEPTRGVAHLWKSGKKAIIPAKEGKLSRVVELTKFENGKFEFKYQSTEPEFLVIADSWHPNWRARLNGEEIDIFKTNGIFKGILLPPGRGTAYLFFDNSPYHFGIWISIFAWGLFILGWGFCKFKLTKKY